MRINHLEVFAGREAIIKIKPTSHVATESFRALSLEDRKCLFADEQNVSIVYMVILLMAF